MAHEKRMEYLQITSESSYKLFKREYENIEDFLSHPKEKDVNLCIQYINLKLESFIKLYEKDSKKSNNENFHKILSELAEYVYYAYSVVDFIKENYKPNFDIDGLYPYLINSISKAKIILKQNLKLDIK